MTFNSYSNDIVDCGGDHPELHIKEDARSVINGGSFMLQNHKWLTVPEWDLIIAHPPCTYLSNVGSKYFSLNCNSENRIEGRTIQRIEAVTFFMQMVRAQCDHVAVENPVGLMSKFFRKPDIIVSPYQFARDENDTENYVQKHTCFWLKGLPPLMPTNDLPKPDNGKLYGYKKDGTGALSWADTRTGKGYEGGGGKRKASSERSKTFPAMARAIADQWGDYVYKVKTGEI